MFLKWKYFEIIFTFVWKCMYRRFPEFYLIIFLIWPQTEKKSHPSWTLFNQLHFKYQILELLILIKSTTHGLNPSHAHTLYWWNWQGHRRCCVTHLLSDCRVPRIIFQHHRSRMSADRRFLALDFGKPLTPTVTLAFCEGDAGAASCSPHRHHFKKPCAYVDSGASSSSARGSGSSWSSVAAAEQMLAQRLVWCRSQLAALPCSQAGRSWVTTAVWLRDKRGEKNLKIKIDFQEFQSGMTLVDVLKRMGPE